MTDTNATTEPTDAPTEELSLQDQHRLIKTRIAEALHRIGDARDWCSDYDLILHRAGVAVRPKNQDSYTGEHHLANVTGEETAAAHAEWQRTAYRSLRDAASRHGVEWSVYRDDLMTAGLRVPARREVIVRGTFQVSHAVEIFDDEDLITKVDNTTVRNLVSSQWYGDGIQWKVTYADEPQADEPQTDEPQDADTDDT